MAAGAGKSDDPSAGLPDESEAPSVNLPSPPQSDADNELPTWTATTAAAPTAYPPPTGFTAPQPAPEPRRTVSTAVPVVLAVVALAGLAGLAGWLIGRSQSSPVESTAGSTVSADATDPGEGEPQTRPEGEDGAQTASTTVPPVGDNSAGVTRTPLPADAEPFVVPPTPDNPSGAAQYAVMTGGKAIMRGWYPAAEHAAQAVADATVIMGPGNVLDETEVDPRAVIDPASFAVYFEDYILFETDSATITPEFFELLDYPLFFMKNSPDATVTVVARTDASGTAEYNLELAARRAEAVRDYWLANGGNADQIILDPRGEESAEEGAGADQARQDRRVELMVSGFLAAG